VEKEGEVEKERNVRPRSRRKENEWMKMEKMTAGTKTVEKDEEEGRSQIVVMIVVMRRKEKVNVMLGKEGNGKEKVTKRLSFVCVYVCGKDCFRRREE
jgi:hypothetical protein